MKCVIFAGGLGTRISEYSDHLPKPLIQVLGKPLIIYIVEHFFSHGITEFIVLGGYRVNDLRKYFEAYAFSGTATRYSRNVSEIVGRIELPGILDGITVTVCDTGVGTETGGRLRYLRKFPGLIEPDEPFFLTYGDGISNVNLTYLRECYDKSSCLIQMTAVRPIARFGHLELDKDGSTVRVFDEKPAGAEGWINGGFFLVNPSIIDLCNSDQCNFEKHVLPKIAAQGQLKVVKHSGYWRCVDSKRDLDLLKNELSEGVLA